MSADKDAMTTSANDLVLDLPGVIFQFHRRHDGHMHFSYLEGGGRALATLDRRQLAIDAGGLLEQLTGEHYPSIMAALERSERWQIPLTTRFRLTFPDASHYWIAISAKPALTDEGCLWRGMMVDISDQVAEEQRLRKLCDTDPLTGLLNRRKLMMYLTHQASLSARHATPLAIMMLDIDHFKQFNDRWGHLQGDQVLRRLAKHTQRSFRCEDMVARLGGEEFVVVLPLTTLEQSVALADRLRHSVAACDFGTGQGEVTLSIGLAEYRAGETLESFIDRADQALYGAKGTGRDCVSTTP